MSEAGKVSLPTPERIEEIRRENEELVKTLIRVPIPSLIYASGQITELLAALEETQHQLHDQDEALIAANGLIEDLQIQLLQAQQTIARLTSALIVERDDALTWDGIGTVNRINKALGETQP